MIRSTLVLLLMLPAAARAADRAAVLSGGSLALDGLCARHVDIRPDPVLHDRIDVRAVADHAGELDRLVFVSGSAPRVSGRPGPCWRPADAASFRPTLVVTIAVPAGAGLVIAESGMADDTIGPVGGALSLDLSGSGRVTAERVAALQVQLSGDGQLRVGRAEGPASLVLSGSGTATIGQAAMDTMAGRNSGSGTVSIGAGTINTAALDVSGSGRIEIGATVGSGTAEVSGSGVIRVARVTGTLVRQTSGSGAVLVGGP